MQFIQSGVGVLLVMHEEGIFNDGERERGRVIFRLVIKLVMWDFRWIGKAGTEFFTGSQDGYMKWWDIR